MIISVEINVWKLRKNIQVKLTWRATAVVLPPGQSVYSNQITMHI